MWDLIRSLCRNEDEVWLVFGDFNEIIDQNDKWGGRERPERQMVEFREVVNACALRDLGYKGPKFTCCNRREANFSISERLNKFLDNSPWWNLFPQASVTHGLASYSNHIHIWLDLEGVQTQKRGKSCLLCG